MAGKDKLLYYHHLLENTNVQAFLLTIRKSENGFDKNAYTALAGMKHFYTGFKHHPNIKGANAAGAYQFEFKTWEEASEALSLPDFSPTSQDIAAVYELDQHHVINDILAGNISSAINKSNGTWMGLPGAKVDKNNHPTLTLNEALKFFTENGGVLNSVGANIIPDGTTYKEFGFIKYLDGYFEMLADANKVIHNYQKHKGYVPMQLFTDLLAKMKNYDHLFEVPHSPGNVINDAFQVNLRLKPKISNTSKLHRGRTKKGKKTQHGHKIGFENPGDPIHLLEQVDNWQNVPSLAKSSENGQNIDIFSATNRLLQTPISNELFNNQKPGAKAKQDFLNIATMSQKQAARPLVHWWEQMFQYNQPARNNETEASLQLFPETTAGVGRTRQPIESKPQVAERNLTQSYHAPVHQQETHKHMTINLNKPLIDHFTVTVKDMREGVSVFKRKVEEVLIEILNNV